MKLNDYIRQNLEQDYLGKRIKAQLVTDCTFIVARITVAPDGPDPQMQILFESQLHIEMSAEASAWQNKNNPTGGKLPPAELHNRWRLGFIESYCLNQIDNELPTIIPDP